MPRSRTMPFALFLLLAILIAACSTTSSPSDDGATESEAGQPSTAASAEASVAPSADPDEPEPGTDLDACEIVTAADIESALELDAGTVAAGELSETPTVLSPGHTDCRYSGDWGGLVVSLTPEDGANLYDAARGSYADASDVVLTGVDGAFWSADQGRFFAWKGAVAVMLQFTHITTGADAKAANTAIAQAAMDRVD